MADTPLIKKLGIKPKYHVLILNTPGGYREQLGTLPADVELVTSTKPAGSFDMVHLFVRNKAELDRDGLKAIQVVTQISIDDVWSALRFRPKSEVGS
jgi:hypothetical protein